ncbi:MAG: large conductance mechanosensitive channel protein MscL [Cucumibacter sp.]
MLKEFREFALKGNMVDMAVGIIVGVAFGAIVASIVDDIFMPVIGLLIGGIDFSNLLVVVGDAGGRAIVSTAQAKELGVATLNVGLFINAVIKFLIIALVLFMVVKGVNMLRRTQPAAPPPAPSRQEALLTEIRDLLKTR